MYVTYHAPGDKAEDLLLGDFLLTRGNSNQSKLIRFGQGRKYGFSAPEIEVNHAALSMGGNALSEALNQGVVLNKLDWYTDTHYAVVHTEIDERDRQQIELFANSVLNAKRGYGYVHLASIAIRLALQTDLFFGISGTNICSGYVAEAMCRAGWIWNENPAFIYPADLAHECNVDLPWFGSA